MNTKLFTRPCCKEQSHNSSGLTSSRMSDLTETQVWPVYDLKLAMKWSCWSDAYQDKRLECIVEQQSFQACTNILLEVIV